MSRYFLVIDIGTTNCKSIIFNEKGEIQKSFYKEFSSIYNRLGTGWIEIDAQVIWGAVCETTKNLLDSYSDLRDKIEGIGVTALRQSILPIDKEGNPIRFVIPWNNNGTKKYINQIKEGIDEATFYEKTGLLINPLWALPSFYYIKEEEPEIFRRTYKFLEVQDFILHKLGTADYVTDYSQASCLSIFNIHKLTWYEELCNFLKITKDQLPRVVPPGSICGRISTDAAKITSLKEGTPICIGGGDTQNSALGCGVIYDNIANVVIGTSAVANAYIEKPTLDPKRSLVCHPHTYPGKYLLDHNTLSGGNAYKWFRDNFIYNNYNIFYNQERSNVYEFMNQEVLSSPPGANGVLFLPHLVGAASPYWNSSATAAFLGINLSTKRSDIIRSIIEGISLELRKGFEIMSDLGVNVTEVRVSGGACGQNSPWNQIQADVYGKPIILMEVKETTSLGAAVLTAVALGEYENVPKAVSNMVRISGEIIPNMENYTIYSELLLLQEEIYNALTSKNVYSVIDTIKDKLLRLYSHPQR